jgi:hypothetical protein
MATVLVWLPTLKTPEGHFPKSSSEARQKALSSIENVGHAALACATEPTLAGGLMRTSIATSAPVASAFRR